MPEDTGTPVEGTPTEAAPAETSAAEPWAPVLDRVNELASGIDSRFAEIEQRFPQAEPEPEPDLWAQLLGEEQPEPEPEPQSLDLAQLRQALLADVNQANAPLMQQLQALQQERGREQLYQMIPELKDPQIAEQTIQGMQQFLVASGAPPEVVQWQINSPQAIANYFKAAEAEKLAQGQAPAGGQVPAVEAAGGAVPGGNGEPPDYVKQAHMGGWTGLPPGLR